MALDKTSYDLPVARTVADLRAAVAAWRREGLRIALVPTMGALHEGHLSLIDVARARADRIVVSLFVNPTQFAPGEDFEAYPREEADDAAKMAARGAHLMYAPIPGEMYAEGFATSVSVSGVSEGLCGASRPHFFGGVATVVTKLLIQCLPDVAVFGEKDYQQLLVIKRLARDLDIPVEIVGGPLIRDENGLALSSRNKYLSAEEREIAYSLNRVLQEIADTAAAGGELAPALKAGTQRLLEAGFDAVDYLEVRDAESLEPLDVVDRPARVFGAARIGMTRLIDNRPAGPSRAKG